MLALHIGCMFPLKRVYSKIILSYDSDRPRLSVEDSSLKTSARFLGCVAIFLAPTIYFHMKYILQVRLDYELNLRILPTYSCIRLASNFKATTTLKASQNNAMICRPTISLQNKWIMMSHCRRQQILFWSYPARIVLAMINVKSCTLDKYSIALHIGSK